MNPWEHLRVNVLSPPLSRKRTLGGSNTSGYRGVSWQASCKRWVAAIEHQRKRTIIGYFKDKIDAAKAYDEKAIELKGNSAKTNF